MLVFGSQMHLITLIILILELMMLPFVLWYYFAWPKDKTRLWYFILMSLLVFYNLTGGLFPDPAIKRIPLQAQNIIAYGSGFIMATFFPFYFYRAFQLEGLKFHALYGAPLFLWFPYMIFFWVVYLVTDDLGLVIDYGMIIPLLYSPVLLLAIFKSINHKFANNANSLHPYGQLEMRAVYWAVAPWVCMTVFSYLSVEQWIEAIVTNSGFILITALFMVRSGQAERLERQRMLELESSGELQNTDFIEMCEKYNLSEREIQVAKLHCEGLTYDQIGERLFISKRTVDTYVQRIYYKTEVNSKIYLQKILRHTSLNLNTNLFNKTPIFDAANNK